MSQNTKILDIKESYIPVDPNAFPQSLHTTGREDSPTGNVPVMFYEGKNFLPTSYGYRSYFGTETTLDVDAIPARVDDVFIIQKGDYTNVLVALTEEGIFTKEGSTTGAWTHDIVLPVPATGVKYEWSRCVIQNRMYFYREDLEYYIVYSNTQEPVTRGEVEGNPNLTLTENDFHPANVFFTVIPTFLNMDGQIGIFKAGSRLGFWDSANSTAWSNIDDFADFEPSNRTQAGNAIFQEVTGTIVNILANQDGFVIYSTKSIILIARDDRFTLQFNPIVLLRNAGIAYRRECCAGARDSMQFAYTNIGLFAVEGNKGELIFTAVTDFFKASNEPVYLRILEGRYLFLEMLDSTYVNGLVSFTTETVPGGVYSFLNTVSDRQSDASSLLDGSYGDMEEYARLSAEALGVSTEGLQPIWQMSYNDEKVVDPSTLEFRPMTIPRDRILQDAYYSDSGEAEPFTPEISQLLPNLIHVGSYEVGSSGYNSLPYPIATVVSRIDGVVPQGRYRDVVIYKRGLLNSINNTDDLAQEGIGVDSNAGRGVAFDVAFPGGVGNIVSFNSFVVPNPVDGELYKYGMTQGDTQYLPETLLVQEVDTNNIISGQAYSEAKQSVLASYFDSTIGVYEPRLYPMVDTSPVYGEPNVQQGNDDSGILPISQTETWTLQQFQDYQQSIWDSNDADVNDVITACATYKQEFIIARGYKAAAGIAGGSPDTAELSKLVVLGNRNTNNPFTGAPAVFNVLGYWGTGFYDYLYEQAAFTVDSGWTPPVTYVANGQIIIERIRGFRTSVNPRVRLEHRTLESHDESARVVQARETTQDLSGNIEERTITGFTRDVTRELEFYESIGDVDIFVTPIDTTGDVNPVQRAVLTLQGFRNANGDTIPLGLVDEASQGVRRYEVPDLELPPISYTLRDGSIAPIYPTIPAALVWDMELQKWGKIFTDYTTLIEYSPINAESQQAIPYANFGIQAGIVRPDGTISLFDKYPLVSYMKIGKIGYYRMGVTKIEEVRTTFRSASTGTIQVETSLDNATVELGLLRTYPFTNEIAFTAYTRNTGKWHNIVITGNYDINHIEFRGTTVGNR